MEKFDLNSKTQKVLRRFGKNKISFYLKNLLSKSLKVPNYVVKEDEDTITISVQISGIENHASDQIQSIIRPMSVELRVTDLDSVDYFLHIRRLAYEIVLRKSSIKIDTGVFHFILHKTRPKLWEALHYHNPKCMVNYRNTMEAFIENHPVFKMKKNILFDKWGIEKLSESGRHIRDLLQHHNITIPHSVKTIDDIIDHLKENLYLESSDEEFLVFAAAVYMKQTQKAGKSGPKLPDVEEPSEKKPNIRTLKAEEANIEGNKCFEAKKYLKANISYFQAVELKPECLPFYRNRAVVFYRTQMYKECIEDLLHVLSVDLLCAKSRWYLGRCFISFYAPDQAVELLYQSKFLDPLLVIDDDLLKASDMSHSLSMYMDSAKCDNGTERERHINSLAKIAKSFIPDNLFNLLMGNNLGSSEFQDGNVYLNVVKECIRFLCERDLIALAKTELEKLIQPFDGRRGELQSLLRPEYYYYFLSLCYYYEDNEQDFMKNFKSYDMKSGFAYLEESDEIDEVRDIYNYRERGNFFFERREYDNAIICYKKELHQSIITDVIECRLYYKIARALFCLSELQEAQQYLKLALARNSNFHEAIALRGEISWKLKSIPSAISDFQKAHELSPCERYRLLVEKTEGFKSSEEKDFLEKIEKESLNSSEIKKREGNKHFTNKDYDVAIKLYTEAISMNANNPIIYSNRAACHIVLKNYEKGLKDAEKALELNPMLVKALLRLSKCNIALGKPEEALTALEKALSIDSEEDSLHCEKAKARFLRDEMLKGDSDFSTKNYDSAEHHFSAALSEAEACTELHLKKIDCLINLDKYDEAIAAGNEALLLDGDNAKVLYKMGLCYFYMVDQENTIEFLEKAREIDPSDTQVEETLKLVKRVYRLNNLERTAVEEKRFDEALLLMEESLKQNSKNKKLKSMANYNMGAIYLDRHDFSKAVGPLTKAINLFPDYEVAYQCRAQCYFKLDEFDKALQDYAKLYKLVPTTKNERALRDIKAIALSVQMKKKMNLKGKNK